jgi:chromosome segregation ATPase
MPPISVPGSMSTPARPGTAARSLSGRLGAAPRPARPLRIDLGDDPLQPAAPWGVDATPTGATGLSVADERLGDLIDQAQAQAIVLRKTLDEAAASDRVVRAHVSELVQRLQQGQRFSAEIDRRIQGAGVAAGVLEKAAATLRGLEQVVEQIRSAQTRMDEQIRLRLEQQQEAFAQRLSEIDARIESRLAAVESKYADALERVERGADVVSARADQRLAGADKELERKIDAMVAGIDRHVAQAQARVSLILDGAGDRLAVMEQQARGVGGPAAQTLDDLCRRATAVLGHDPRTASPADRPAQGSLAWAVERAETIIEEANQSGLRLGALQGGARALVEELVKAQADARATIEQSEPLREQIRQRLDETLTRAATAQTALEQAVAAQREAVDAGREHSALLARQRDDLGAMAAAGEHHVARAREAAAGLHAKIDAASLQARSLDEAVERVREQAESIVAMARRVAALVPGRPEGEGEVTGGAGV